MDIIFINSKSSKTSDPYRSLLNLAVKINLKRSDKYIGLRNLGIYYIQKNMKKSYKSNKFKISTPTQNEDYDLPDGSYSVSDMKQIRYSVLNMEKRLLILQ